MVRTSSRESTTVGAGAVTNAGTGAGAQPGRRRGTVPLVATLVLGVGLVLAPVAFQMFSRAPKGADMLDGFRPYMTATKVAQFQGYLEIIDGAAVETEDQVAPDAEATLDLGPGGFADAYPLTADFEDQWPAIDADMSDMLDTMERNLDNFAAVDALPPFGLFPWFFVLPGLVIAGLAIATLLARRRGRSTRTLVVLLGIMGIGLIAAPAVFQMFSRAPEGKDMIDDFRPLMTEEKVRAIQGYFVTIGAGEGQLRLDVLPDLEAAGDETAYPAVDAFSAEWPMINNEFAPMIGAMSDNLGNYEAVDALPPFTLFPWFFVIPGVLVIVFTFFAWPRRDASSQVNQ
jgi:hypothetical protein